MAWQNTCHKRRDSTSARHHRGNDAALRPINRTGERWDFGLVCLSKAFRRIATIRNSGPLRAKGVEPCGGLQTQRRAGPVGANTLEVKQKKPTGITNNAEKKYTMASTSSAGRRAMQNWANKQKLSNAGVDLELRLSNNWNDCVDTRSGVVTNGRGSVNR